MVSQAIAQGDIQAINYFVAQKYVEALKEMAAAPNQKVCSCRWRPPASLGALGGIAELATMRWRASRRRRARVGASRRRAIRRRRARRSGRLNRAPP